MLVGEQRIDIQLGHLRNVGEQLRDPQENGFDRLAIHRRAIPVAGELFRHASAGNEVAGQKRIEWRQCDGRVRNLIGSSAALSEQDKGAEYRVGRCADDQLEGARAPDHALNRESPQRGVRAQCAHPLEHFRRRIDEHVGCLDVEGDAPDVGLVRDVGRKNLQDDRKTELPGRAVCRVDVGRDARVNDRNPVCTQDRLRFRFAEQ